MYVKWGSTMSSKFHVTNGVRQGGVLSLLLFNVYVNDLHKSGVGRSMNGTFRVCYLARALQIEFTRAICGSRKSLYVLW